MSEDRKFERDEDREVTPSEIKNRLIVLMENRFEMPEVHIYDEPVRYLKMNLEWFKIFAGWLSWMEHPGFWKEAEDEDFDAIHQILLFEEGIEAMSIDYDAWYLANRNAIYDALNDIAKQIVSGRTTNIDVGEDGTVTDPTEEIGGEDAPEDDPATVDIDERKASQYAGFLSVAYGLNEFLPLLQSLYGADATADTSLTDATAIISSRYVVDASMAAALADYWASRAAGTAQIISLDREDLTNYLYCNKMGDTENNAAAFISALVGFSIAQKLICIGVVTGMEETQWRIWYQAGSDTMTTEYKSAPCEPIDDYQFTLQFNTLFVDTHILKAYHRYEVTGEGLGVDTDGDQQDLWWHKPLSGNEAFDAADFNIQIGSAVKIKPDVFEAPYNATTHKYIWTIDMGAINAGPQWTINRDSIMSVATTSPTGGFLIEVRDLGLYR